MVGLLPRLVKDTEQRLVEDDFHESPALARHCVQRLVAFTLRLITRLSTFETKASVLRGILFAFLNYQIKVFTTPLRMPFAPLPS